MSGAGIIPASSAFVGAAPLRAGRGHYSCGLDMGKRHSLRASRGHCSCGLVAGKRRPLRVGRRRLPLRSPPFCAAFVVKIQQELFYAIQFHHI
ncbi:hypothetical protein B296_00016253 [Ensete ventricosum]|uniref:Uncharacterized protein n=1 Tax=Ensete ventricosum TaxID=4639 RepID=A0A426ZWV2_ENSVE|nr:hypothetical protein B296_00016253 [Ensete ventricosum]